MKQIRFFLILGQRTSPLGGGVYISIRIRVIFIVTLFLTLARYWIFAKLPKTASIRHIALLEISQISFFTIFSKSIILIFAPEFALFKKGNFKTNCVIAFSGIVCYARIRQEKEASGKHENLKRQRLAEADVPVSRTVFDDSSVRSFSVHLPLHTAIWCTDCV